ncbi:YhgE/Pip domain-containing protein [Herbiconiux flava]|uniref:Putative membrane protein n=1 Tax=Herbiconiux flava TaxID=881268 RepID=A0A852SJB9_9MICO|nr:YhgE/Pip domain-containing protein [Herbiconiux flava]NYD69403.1 putative membrane protein [Herbiconiux flava]GLK16148.1 ABC transporter [Herbiconiux flava]
MKIYHLVATELKRLTATGMAKLALVALMLVPVLYAGLYLWANNDPYGNLKDVPVALVVEDTGATVDGEQVDYGQQVEDQLLEDESVGWIVTDADTAEQGVRDGTFDFILTLGPDFSTALTSAEGDAPTQAVVELTTNDTNSFLATTIAGQVAEKVRASITEQVGKEAALKLLDGFATVRENLTTAVDGADQLADGTASASDGGQQLASGAGTANIGALQLADGLQQLQAGSAALPDQANQLNDGAQQLSTGLQQLQAGSASLPGDTARLNDGAQQVAAGNAQLASTASGLATEVQDAVNQAAAVRSDAEAAIAASALTPEQKQALLADIAQIATAVDSGNAQVQAANTQIGTLAAGSAQVAAGTQQLADSAPQLSGGIATAASGATQLAAGTQQLADAAPALTNGIASAASGASQLAGGVTQLAQGSLDLAGGLGTLDSGADELRDGLASGLDDVPNQTADQRETAAQTISDPVAVDSDAVTKASNYGAGMAPFFISLAAWIGIYALFLIVKPLSRRALTALKRPFTATTAGWAAPALLGAVQMLAVFGIITLALGYQVEHPWGMLGFMVLTSATFATIILALNILLGSVGQFLGLVLMVLQLVTAGGTFPWQTLPGPLQVLHQVLPMSHAVDGIRQLMYGGDVSLAGADAGALFFWLAGALLVSYLGARRMTRHRTLRDLRPSLIG